MIRLTVQSIKMLKTRAKTSESSREHRHESLNAVSITYTRTQDKVPRWRKFNHFSPLNNCVRSTMYVLLIVPNRARVLSSTISLPFIDSLGCNYALFTSTLIHRRDFSFSRCYRRSSSPEPRCQGPHAW